MNQFLYNCHTVAGQITYRNLQYNGLWLAALAALIVNFPLPGRAADTAALIQIQTVPASPVPPGFSGFNAPQPRNGVEYADPKFVAAATPLNPGWLRYPGGTVSMAFDWSTAHINTAWMNSLILAEPPLVSTQTASILTTAQALTQAKGGVAFSDFAKFANTLGSSAIICFNSYTDSNTGSATEMTRAVRSYGLNVLEWELGNEAYLYPSIFPTAAYYAAASNPYFNEITTGAANATVGLFLAGLFTGVPGQYTTWDNGLSYAIPPGYTPHYWNAASNHIYPIASNKSPQDTIWLLNGILAHASSDYIRSYVLPLVGPAAPVFITEFNCCSDQSNEFLTYIYNGIFLAEYIARLSTVPNVKGVGINSLYTDNADYHGLIQSVNDFETYLLGQVAANPNFETNTAINPNTQFQFYTSAPGLAMALANQAINGSEELLPTTVTGGASVGIAGFGGQDILAVYAQAYLTQSGEHRLLITNKSAESQVVVIQVNGVQITNTLNLSFVSNSSAIASNTAQSPVNVTTQTGTSANPTRVGPYSVTMVTW